MRKSRGVENSHKLSEQLCTLKAKAQGAGAVGTLEAHLGSTRTWPDHGSCKSLIPLPGSRKRKITILNPTHVADPTRKPFRSFVHEFSCSSLAAEPLDALKMPTRKRQV